jgi:hypothetical protein
MRQRQSRGDYPPARQSRAGNEYGRYSADAEDAMDDADIQDTRVTDDLDNEEYDGVWPHVYNSARRLQSRADVRGNVGRVPADAQGKAYQDLIFGGRAANVPPRSSTTRTDMPTVSPRRRQQVYPDTDADLYEREPRRERRRPHFHWLFFVGLAMITMLLGWMLLTMVANWWQITQDDWHYGRPRTYQVDQVVGHNDSAQNPSHFIAINLRRQVEVIEFPGGDATHAKIYMGPLLLGPEQDLAPVTLSFRDVNGDGKIDMIVNVQGSHFIFLNTGTQFRAAN